MKKKSVYIFLKEYKALIFGVSILFFLLTLAVSFVWSSQLLRSFFLSGIGFSEKKPDANSLLTALAHSEDPLSYRRIEDTRCAGFRETQGSGLNLGTAQLSIDLPRSQKMAGYGAFPFQPLFGRIAAPGGTLTAQVAVFMQSDVAWFVTALDAIGAPGNISHRIELALKKKFLGGTTPLKCLVSSLVSSHSHSAADLTGLWGGASTGFDSSKNKQILEDLVYKPFVERLQEAAQAAYMRAKVNEPVQIMRSEGFVETTETKDFGRRNNLTMLSAKPVGESDSGSEGITSSVPLVVNDGLKNDEGMGHLTGFVLWIWGAHATTDDQKSHRTSGDFIDDVKRKVLLSAGQGLKPDLMFFPGAIAGSYPVEEEGWKDKIGNTLQAVTESLPAVNSDKTDKADLSGSYDSIAMRTVTYCVVPTSRLFQVFDSWASFWGGAGAEYCQINDVGENARKTGVKVHLQEVHFKETLQVSRTDGQVVASAGLRLVIAPFEVFTEVEKHLKTQFGDLEAAQIRVVSLGNGFLGHGLSRDQFFSLVHSEKTNRGAASSYHTLLAPFSEVETVFIDFLTY